MIENIFNFVVDIDNKDIIHIIYVDKNNNIRYSAYSNELIENKYFNIKDEANDYRFLFLKFIIDRLYFFFITRPSNNAECMLKICILKDSNVTVENILTVNCSKYTCPYFIYSTSDSIYILYSKDSNEKYTIQILDIHKNKWYEHSNTITLEKASHINFIVKDDIALICYNSFQNNNLQLKLASINLKNSSSINEKTLLSNTNSTSLHPLIFTFENATSILWVENEQLTYYNFAYDKIITAKEQHIPVENCEIHYANYRSNFCEDLKVNNIIPYTFNDSFLSIITDLQNITHFQAKKTSENLLNKIHKEVSKLEKESSTLEEKTSYLEEMFHHAEPTTFTPINFDFLEITPYLNNYIKELYSSVNNTNELLSRHIENNRKLNSEIDYLAKLNSSYKSRIEDLKNRLVEYRNDSAAVLMKYKDVISDMEINKKKLVNLIEEKNAEISLLQHIVNSHKEIN